MIIACKQCGFGVSDQGLTCPKCGAPTPIAKDRASRLRRIVLVMFVIVCVFAGFLSNYRIVLGVPGLIVRRTVIGFDNPIATTSICTAGQGAAIVDTTRPLCRDLNNSGVFSNVVPAGRAPR